MHILLYEGNYARTRNRRREQYCTSHHDFAVAVICWCVAFRNTGTFQSTLLGSQDDFSLAFALEWQEMLDCCDVEREVVDMIFGL
jgi:hypothetical protein